MHIRPLEKKDLKDVHKINNELKIMAYWFEEPYQSLSELESLYERHLRDESERRFVVEEKGVFAGIVELVELDYIHRNCEIQVIITDKFKGMGLAEKSMIEIVSYAFDILNMHKVYLYVDTDNKKAIHIYEKLGFKEEGYLREHFYTMGEYKDSFMMGVLKREWNREISEDF
ncbi:GNAT family N-acetyltransferase [Anaerosphaera multitolerans]|uniref:GNAT family N-acetyltransferase n=1 Tax=Anaerosphaera multitolerans TaxID=2487351 RepID=A0A437S9B9_9FIRM|nr:GNAT family N-acetyltransferase [Anaerosphaera multitolerans]RVU55713.1 GNAT family N-acetyltransferase [Anaerosphaera multitolerans]